MYPRLAIPLYYYLERSRILSFRKTGLIDFLFGPGQTGLGTSAAHTNKGAMQNISECQMTRGLEKFRFQMDAAKSY